MGQQQPVHSSMGSYSAEHLPFGTYYPVSYQKSRMPATQKLAKNNQTQSQVKHCLPTGTQEVVRYWLGTQDSNLNTLRGEIQKTIQGRIEGCLRSLGYQEIPNESVLAYQNMHMVKIEPSPFSLGNLEKTVLLQLSE